MRQNKIGTNEFEIDLRALAYELFRKLWIIILCAFIFASASFVYSEYAIDKEYMSSTKMFILYQNKDSSKPTQNDLLTGGLLASDFEEIIKSRNVMNEVISDLKLNTSPDALSSTVSVSVKEGTRIIYIHVTAKDPYLARDIADKVREVSSKRMVEIMNIDAVNVIDVASLPVNPVSPSIKKNVMLGAVIGAVIACAYFAIKYIFDDTIAIPDDVDVHLDLSVLAVIPDDDTHKKTIKHHMKKINR